MTSGDDETRNEIESDSIEVTRHNFGDLLIAGLEEALEVACGKMEPARRVVHPRSDASSAGGG
ncbi:MAG TPA: hypothetical protein VEX86_01690 [Longimicrobium sp.]|nr:hypothetical protein [Longimicrobium sp.]